MGLDKEIKYGRRNFLILYFASAVMGNMTTILMRPCALAVGSSTAGFGLVGSILAEILLVWPKLDERTRQMYTLDITVFGALMILLSYGQTVDIWGHLGGFVCGVAVTCEFNKGLRDLPAWFNLTLNGTRTVCTGIIILTVARVFLGLPLPMVRTSGIPFLSQNHTSDVCRGAHKRIYNDGAVRLLLAAPIFPPSIDQKPSLKYFLICLSNSSLLELLSSTKSARFAFSDRDNCALIIFCRTFSEQLLS